MTLTIDEAALEQVTDRHMITAGMVLELSMLGERVDRARLLAAGDHATLRTALGPAQVSGILSGPLVLSYHCFNCGLWIAGAPESDGQCQICAALTSG